ncbi:DUF2513 domain-containing protein [Pseudochrobactrum sp. MP213Fo]|uniref:DUF2513 domain-containing protein n=1 Tax=Pseudochrobactrum sp. MP213Fo TaxID=3022250 RepID=UPI003B9F99D6
MSGIDHIARVYKYSVGADMKLNMDLVRTLLLYVEEKADRPISNLENILIEDWSSDDVAYHVMLCEEAGFIVAQIDTMPDIEDPVILHVNYTVYRLTLNGHEFLDATRAPQHWIAIKGNAQKLGVNSLKAVGRIAEDYITHLIKQSFTGG